MKILATLKDLESFNDIKAYADGVILTNSFISARYDISFSKEEIHSIIKKCNTARMESYLLINAIFHDKDLAKAYEFINEFKDTNINYIFSDLAVYQILKEYDITKKGVYNPNTLVTNYVDYIFFEDYKLKGLTPALEIPLSDIEIIGKNKKRKMYYQGFGYSVMFQSKRNLLSTYKEYKHLDFNEKSMNLFLKEETRDEKYRIVENEHGTHIFQYGIHNILPALDIILDVTDYLIVDGTFIDKDKYLEALSIYNEALCDLDHLNLYNDRLALIFDNLSYQFMYEDSVFKKGDF